MRFNYSDYRHPDRKAVFVRRRARAAGVVGHVLTRSGCDVVDPDRSDARRGGALARSRCPAPARRTRPTNLDARVRDLKGEVIRLNRDLLVLEEELLFPAGTPGGGVRLDGRRQDVLARLGAGEARRQVVANYLYTPLRGRGAAPRRRAAPVPRQPARRQAQIVAFFTGRAARARLQARRDAQDRQRAPGRSTSSCASSTRRPSCSRSSTSRSGSSNPRPCCASPPPNAAPVRRRSRSRRPRARGGRRAGRARTVQDPHYGDTLFQFYQDRYFTALVGLMVSQHFDRVRPPCRRGRGAARRLCCCPTACRTRPARSSRA